MVGFSCFLPKYQASPANCIPRAPAITDSVWAELGLAWFLRSRFQIPAARFPSITGTPRTVSRLSRQLARIINSAEILDGR